MTTIKSYTDIEQAKKLAEFLPLESADMKWFIPADNEGEFIEDVSFIKYPSEYYSFEKVTDWNDVPSVPCWSLAALLELMPVLERKGYQRAKPQLLYNVTINKWIVDSHVCTTDAYDNPVDACYEMIIRLNELNLL